MERRNTLQKQLVFNAVTKLANHPTAEQVYVEIHPKHPNVSKATVYRNLAALAEAGRLKHIPMPDGADRFDHTLEEHSHITCARCGGFTDAKVMDVATAERLNSFASAHTGYVDISHSIVFKGVCPVCNLAEMAKQRMPEM